MKSITYDKTDEQRCEGTNSDLDVKSITTEKFIF